MMVLAFALAGLVVSGLIQPWQIIVMALLLGVAQSFDAPARQAFVDIPFVEHVQEKTPCHTAQQDQTDPERGVTIIGVNRRGRVGHRFFLILSAGLVQKRVTS